MEESRPGAAPPEPTPETAGHLGSASLYCERCGRETLHRIFRVRRGTRVGARAVEGVARCRECRWTHPFESAPEERTEVSAIVSDGPRSVRRALSLPPDQILEVGSVLPGLDERAIVRRIDARNGRAVSRGRADEVSTLWAMRDAGAVVRVSVIDGATTHPGRIVVPPGTPFEVGGELAIEGVRMVIVALRARGRTWRLPGDAFPAGEVQRLYGRRIVRPPAGSSVWRRGRPMPRSRTSSSSRADRSRSSPGVRKTRTSPRARTAASGAAVHRS